MTKTRNGSSNGEEQRKSPPSNSVKGDPVPRRLQEAEDLLNSINNRLEECSVEWQAVVSRKQWTFVDTDGFQRKKPWQSTILARRYFTDKILDGAFKTLLSSNKLFTDHLRNFIELLQNVKSVANRSGSSSQALYKPTLSDESGSNRAVELQNKSLSETQLSTSTKQVKRPTDKAITTIRNSFVDVVKAKVDFDIKFLGFESVLHGSSNAQHFNTSCLCQICSDVIGSVVEKRSNGPNVSTRRRSKTIRRNKRKRLTRSEGTLTRRRNKGRPSPIDFVGDQCPAAATAATTTTTTTTANKS